MYDLKRRRTKRCRLCTAYEKGFKYAECMRVGSSYFDPHSLAKDHGYRIGDLTRVMYFRAFFGALPYPIESDGYGRILSIGERPAADSPWRCGLYHPGLAPPSMPQGDQARPTYEAGTALYLKTRRTTDCHACLVFDRGLYDATCLRVGQDYFDRKETAYMRGYNDGTLEHDLYTEGFNAVAPFNIVKDDQNRILSIGEARTFDTELEAALQSIKKPSDPDPDILGE